MTMKLRIITLVLLHSSLFSIHHSAAAAEQRTTDESASTSSQGKHSSAEQRTTDESASSSGRRSEGEAFKRRASSIKPNVILFLIDDMGLMDTSVPFIVDAKGQPVKHSLNGFYRTPNMERLAAAGTRFTQFYAHSVCSPTRASIMTGQNSARHRSTNWIKPQSNNRGNFGPAEWN